MQSEKRAKLKSNSVILYYTQHYKLYYKHAQTWCKATPSSCFTGYKIDQNFRKFIKQETNHNKKMKLLAILASTVLAANNIFTQFELSLNNVS